MRRDQLSPPSAAPLLEILEPRLLLDVAADPLPSPAPPALTTPGNEIPVELVSQWGGPAHSVAVSGHFAYVCLGPGLCVFDVADPAQPRFLGKVDLGARANDVVLSGNLAFVDVVVSGNLAYVADYDAGLQIIDVSNPAAPVRRGAYDTSGWASGVYVSGNLAYVADYYNGLLIIDVSNPTVPVRLGGYETSGHAEVVYV